MSSTRNPPIIPFASDTGATAVIYWRALMLAMGCEESHVYPVGLELFRQDSSPGYVYFVETGVAKLTRFEENGGEFILDIRFAGSLLGSEAAIRNKPHPFSAVTAT